MILENKFGKQRASLSVDQLSQALELTDDRDTTQEEQKLLQGIVTFGNTDTKQVMKNRMDIFALNEAWASSASTQKRKWSPSMVRGVVALVICTIIDEIGVSAWNPTESPRFNWKADGNPSRRIALR